MKGADVVMAGIVQYNDWLEEEVGILLFFYKHMMKIWQQPFLSLL